MSENEIHGTHKKYRTEILAYGIYGPSESGKTSLIEEIITGLNERGFKVATIKHTRGKFRLDEKGKDTWRHRNAGAAITVFSSPVETTFIKDGTTELGPILQKISQIGDYDIVLVEGFSNSKIPKIAVKEFDSQDKIAKNTVLQYKGNKEKILDHLTRKIEIHRLYTKLPGLNCGECDFDSCWQMAKAIYEGETTFENCEHLPSQGTKLQVNGRNIPLSGFPSRIIRETIRGMLNTLKGVSNPKNIDLQIKDIADNEK